jgi:hypothetical protein
VEKDRQSGQVPNGEHGQSSCSVLAAEPVGVTATAPCVPARQGEGKDVPV